MTEKELHNEYRKSDCKSFTDFLINKIAELQHKVEVLQGYLDHDIEYDMDKAIQNLKKKNAELKKGCDETQELLDKQIEATYKLDKENAELKQQIEKAIGIIRDLGSTVREGVTCHYLVDNGGLHRATLFLKEIKENGM